MVDRLRAIAFDPDVASLTSLRGALPGWAIEVVHGATAATLSPDWNPGPADLLVVNARDDAAETLGLCRFLTFCGAFSRDAREARADALARPGSRPDREARVDAPLLVLVPPGQEALVRAALEAGADSCLVLPVHSKQVTSLLARAWAGNRPGRHTLDLDRAPTADVWRDEGGQG
jgi:hypothetical protein